MHSLSPSFCQFMSGFRSVNEQISRFANLHDVTVKSYCWSEGVEMKCAGGPDQWQAEYCAPLLLIPHSSSSSHGCSDARKLTSLD